VTVANDVLVLYDKIQDRLDFIEAFLDQHDCNLIRRDLTYPLTEDAMCDLVRDVDGVITGQEQISARVLDHANRLRVISVSGVGYDRIDVDAATARGIAVCNCPGCNNRSVAELAFAMMVGLSRNVYAADRAMRANGWDRYYGPELNGKTLGIVGLGRVGKSVALLGEAYGMRLIATDLVWDITFANEHHIHYVPLDTLLAEADYVTVHVPLTDSTHDLIDERALGLMKPTAFLINTARGPVVNESALFDALKSSKIAGAGIDVFTVEPPPICPFAEFDNVIMTPHLGGSTYEAVNRAMNLALLNVTGILNGREPHSQVNDPVLRSHGTA
jgi:D-3-phosphoglycerate dehydrogenase